MENWGLKTGTEGWKVLEYRVAAFTRRVGPIPGKTGGSWEAIKSKFSSMSKDDLTKQKTGQCGSHSQHRAWQQLKRGGEKLGLEIKSVGFPSCHE